MVSDRHNEETAIRSEEIDNKEKRINRISNITSGLGTLVAVGGIISAGSYSDYMEESTQFLKYKKTLDQVIERVETNLKKGTLQFQFNDPEMSKDFQWANELERKRKEPLEVALKTAYDLREKIVNSPEYREYLDNMDYIMWAATSLGFLIIVAGGPIYNPIAKYRLKKFQKSISAIPAVSRPKS